jgi:hypothetical protein
MEIFSECDRLKMGWIHTPRMPTEVVEGKAVRYRPNQEFIG